MRTPSCGVVEADDDRGHVANDIRELGRLGRAMNAGAGASTSRRRRPAGVRRDGAYVSRRRLVRVPRPVLWLLVVLSVAIVWVGMAASRQADPRVALATIPAAPAPFEDVGPRLDGGQRVSRAAAESLPALAPSTFATVDGLPLQLPYAGPIAIGYHEASRPEALALDPVGRLIANDNPTKFSPGDDRPGPAYRVLSSRGRARPATSAVDVVLPKGGLVAAPVTGRVVEVRDYALYGSLRDWRVVIEPEQRPDLQIVLIHLERPQVRPGDRVRAGSTPIAVVRLLPMASHIDYVLNQRNPHVHIEVKPAVEPEPYDPNAPAVEAEEDADGAHG